MRTLGYEAFCSTNVHNLFVSSSFLRSVTLDVCYDLEIVCQVNARSLQEFSNALLEGLASWRVFTISGVDSGVDLFS